MSKGEALRAPVKRMFRALGYEVHRLSSRSPTADLPADFTNAEIDLWRTVSPFTMTSPAAVYVLADAVRYLVANAIQGAFVECGVWRGGSMMVVAQTLIERGRTDADLYLFDTFEGMVEPTQVDVSRTGETAEEFERVAGKDWATASLEQVQTALRLVPYAASKIHFVKGRVEDTIPKRAPDHIALLRLDTDWYESTKHELFHLYPRLAPGGVLIIDDYAYWRGARTATDEFFRELGVHPFLVRIDSDGRRVAIKR
jgi:O-methyltransferase